jgi:hypothetical protein
MMLRDRYLPSLLCVPVVFFGGLPFSFEAKAHDDEKETTQGSVSKEIERTLKRGSMASEEVILKRRLEASLYYLEHPNR